MNSLYESLKTSYLQDCNTNIMPEMEGHTYIHTYIYINYIYICDMICIILTQCSNTTIP